MVDTYEPKGLRFWDAASRRDMLLVEDGDESGFGGWIVYRHPDGQWVTFREATPSDCAALAAVLSYLSPREGTRSNSW